MANRGAAQQPVAKHGSAANPLNIREQIERLYSAMDITFIKESNLDETSVSMDLLSDSLDLAWTGKHGWRLFILPS